MLINKNIFFSSFLIILSLFLRIDKISAAIVTCPTSGSPTITSSCILNNNANYTNLTITGGAVVTSDVGQKIDITVSETFTIQAGGGIDISGKGNNSAGKGGDAGSTGSGCVGLLAGGGGGGGYGGAGGNGATDASASGAAGGASYGLNNSPADLGSPGGLGGGNSSGNGMGGGAVKITAKNLILNGYIKANGTNGSDPRGNDGSGGGGGGSGGSIWLIALDRFDFSGGLIETKGGDGGADGNCGGWDGAGGGGGGGRISVQHKGPTIGAGAHTEAAGAGGSSRLAGSPGNVGTFYEDLCFNNTCANYCDSLTAYRSGTCNPSTGNCNYTTIQNCADANNCTYDTCDAGVCGNANLCGGLVPCGRLVKGNDPNIDMTKPCDLCAGFYMLKNIINFVTELVVGIAVLVFVIAGLLYVFSSGEPGKIELAKSAVSYALISLVIVFVSWVAIAAILQALGYANIATWNQVNCNLQT